MPTRTGWRPACASGSMAHSAVNSSTMRGGEHRSRSANCGFAVVPTMRAGPQRAPALARGNAPSASGPCPGPDVSSSSISRNCSCTASRRPDRQAFGRAISRAAPRPEGELGQRTRYRPAEGHRSDPLEGTVSARRRGVTPRCVRCAGMPTWCRHAGSGAMERRRVTVAKPALIGAAQVALLWKVRVERGSGMRLGPTGRARTAPRRSNQMHARPQEPEGLGHLEQRDPPPAARRGRSLERQREVGEVSQGVAAQHPSSDASGNAWRGVGLEEASPVLLAVSMPIERSAPMTRYRRVPRCAQVPVPQARSRSTEPSGAEGAPWPCASLVEAERHDAVHEVIRGRWCRTSSVPAVLVVRGMALRWSSAGSSACTDTWPTTVRVATPGSVPALRGQSHPSLLDPLVCGRGATACQITQRDRPSEHRRAQWNQIFS